jgi:hypothetical protein
MKDLGRYVEQISELLLRGEGIVGDGGQVRKLKVPTAPNRTHYHTP